MGIIVNPETKVSVTLTAGEYLRYAITGAGGKAIVMEQTSPSAQVELSTATSGTTTLGPYGATKSLVIAADNCVVEYDTGATAALETGSADTLKNSGVMVLANAGAPVDYTDGDPAATGEGWAAPGALLVDTTNMKLYLNGGTAAQPLWKLVASTETAGGADTLLNSGAMVYAGAGAPVDYTDGDPAATGEAEAEIGSLYVDTTNAKLYINGGTKAQPLWRIVLNATTAGEFFFSGAGAPVDYTDGDPAATGEGVASIGAIYSDVTNGKLYVNGGTQAQPVWKIVTSAA